MTVVAIVAIAVAGLIVFAFALAFASELGRRRELRQLQQQELS